MIKLIKRFFKILLIAISFSLIFCECGCGDVSKVKRVTESSQHFSTKEIESGFKVVENYFWVNFDNCVLKELKFVENSESERKALIEKFNLFDDLPKSDDIIEYELLVNEYKDGELYSSDIPYNCCLGRFNKGSWKLLEIGLV